MNTTDKTEAAFDETVEILSDRELDSVTGGINPQPLPPRHPDFE
jgi:bacteriocin-like protein